MAEPTDSTNLTVGKPAENAETSTTKMTPQEELSDLTAKATAEYAVKHYSEAAELYSQASELQAELNGDMAVENADLLYAYGKCLFYLAQQTSSVLGGTAASAQLTSKKEKKSAKKRKPNVAQQNGGQSSSANGVESATNGDSAVPNVGDVVPEDALKPESTADPNKPFFQISGDDPTWDESDEEEEGDAEAEGEEEEEDDFANAFELLDLARVLYLRKLDGLQQNTLDKADKGKYVASIDLDPSVKEVKKRVADIYDLQAEVSLEGEKYSAAVSDLKSCLALKEELESPDSSLLAECHYKLSLALEFSSQNQQRDADGNPVGELVVDWTIRDEAIVHQEKAIECCKLRITHETKALESLPAGNEKDKAMAQIEDVQDMVSEMETRLAELRKPPVSVKAETESEMKEQIQGVLGSILGASAEEQKQKLEEASAGAKDLSGLVKKKKPKTTTTNGGDSGFGSAASTPAPVPTAPESSTSTTTQKVTGKRKVEFADDVVDTQGEAATMTKRARVEDAEDSGT